jgi:hypothetical protein
MNKLKLAFRNYASQPVLLQLMKEAANAKHNLDWDLEYIGGTEEAAVSLLKEDIDIIIGQHYTPYYDLAQGRKLVCLATGENHFRNRLVTVPKITNVSQIGGERLVVPDEDWDSCMGLSMRVWMDQHGLGDKMEPVPVKPGTELNEVLGGRGDACFLSDHRVLRAREAGLMVHDYLPLLTSIQGVTITTKWGVVQEKAALLKDFLKSMIDAIHFYKTKKEETLAIMEEVGKKTGRGGREKKYLEYGYREFVNNLEARPYPHPLAIMNAFAKCVKLYPEASGVNPQVLWDTHLLREIDESGYIDALYR